MTVLAIIFGVLMILCGFGCFFTPLLTFMDMGYFIVIMATVYGVIGIVKGCTEKRFGISFVFSILSVIFGVAVLLLPKLMFIADTVLIYMTATWLVLQGIVSLVTSFTVTKKRGSGMWVWQMIIGILAILLGCYSYFHPAVVAISLGLLIGIWFIETGIAMICISASGKD